MTEPDVDHAIHVIEAAIQNAQANETDYVTFTTTLRGAIAVVIALRTMHKDAPALALLPGDIAGDVLMNMRLNKLADLIDRLGPLVIMLERNTEGTT